MVTMLERERAILTVLYVILSGPAYGKSSAVTIAGSERKSDGKKKKKKKGNSGTVPTESHF